MAGLASLLRSRKFWLTFFGIVALGIGLYRHDLDPKTFAELASAAVMVLVLGIAHEDNGTKGGANLPTTGGDQGPRADSPNAP